jgi:hypothetical protein
MRQNAKQNIQHYIDEFLPTEFQHCLDALKMIVKVMWALHPQDYRELMRSRSLTKECCAMRIDFPGSGTVVDRAVKLSSIIATKTKNPFNLHHKTIIETRTDRDHINIEDKSDLTS